MSQLQVLQPYIEVLNCLVDRNVELVCAECTTRGEPTPFRCTTDDDFRKHYDQYHASVPFPNTYSDSVGQSSNCTAKYNLYLVYDKCTRRVGFTLDYERMRVFARRHPTTEINLHCMQHRKWEEVCNICLTRGVTIPFISKTHEELTAHLDTAHFAPQPSTSGRITTRL